LFAIYSLGMSESSSNMPEMNWLPAIGGGLIAYPNGTENKDQYLLIGAEDQTRPHGGRRFDWFINWTGRFRGVNGSPTEEEAKRTLTEEWWLAVERTEGWKPGDPEIDLYPRSMVDGAIDWRLGEALHAEFKAKMKRFHEERLAERAALRKRVRATQMGAIGMIGPPDPRKGRGWKPKR